jgi:hypothetical protein
MLNNLNGYYFTGILGRPGLGKMSFLVSLLTGKGKDKVFRKGFDNLYLIMPSSSRHSMKYIYLKIMMKVKCMLNLHYQI